MSLESKRVIVAIDGPAGAGKSTIARQVAQKLGFIYIDTGAMYRAVALWAIRRDVSPSDMHRLEQLANEASIELDSDDQRVLLNDEDVTDSIRTADVTAMASQVAAVPGVRRALVEKQRAMGEQGSVVMEGRDIGSVVFPHAQVKVFLDAHAEVRAGRRATETGDHRGSVAQDIAERDERDRGRVEAPLVQAPDAVYLDSSSMSIDEVVAAVLRLVREKTANGKEYAR